MKKVWSWKIYFSMFLLFTIHCSLFTVSHAADATEIMKKTQLAFLYPGKDMKVRVYMKLISKDGKERIQDRGCLSEDRI